MLETKNKGAEEVREKVLNEKWHTYSAQTVLELLGSSENGLTQKTIAENVLISDLMN